MQCKFLLFATLSLLIAGCSQAGENVSLNYQYTEDHGIDFSKMPRGPMKVNAFTDQRELDNSQTIQYIDEQAGDQLIATGKPVTQTVADAFSQAFEAGGAELVESGENLLFSGEVLTFDAAQKADGEIEFNIKTKLSVKNKGNNVWNSTVISRASVAGEDGIDGAVDAALDKLIEELMYDDYFLMAVVD